ncbi:hypothetical protein DHC50_03550 [Arenibacter sp. A80]|nr:hypothetical protein [Arenibacter sp. A80]RFT58225.1 hypothetical protein D0S24_03550 [Arenibacter sp. P308M17]
MESIDKNCWDIPHPEELQMAENNSATNLHESIKKSPIGCKNVFKLCALEGHKYNSAADHLGISVNIV